MRTRRFFWIPLLVATFAVASTSPSWAQNTPERTDRTVTRVDDGFDWGWLGLLGLAGLYGLKRRPESHEYTTTRPAR